MRLCSKDWGKVLMVFGRYARYYDAIYKTKDYKGECVYLEKLFKKHAQNKIKAVLDLGCGTANYMVPFIQKGYHMTGVDASAQMLKLAAQKLDRLDLKADLILGKLQSFQLHRTFDAALCLFSVIDYITQKEELLSALRNIAGHMKKTSLFIFDFWNESAVNAHYSPTKRNLFQANGRVIERCSTTQIYPSKRLCEVRYRCTLKQDGQLVRRDREKHVLRYFSVEEMREYLKMAGLKAIDIHPFLRLNGKVRKNTWDVTIVAQRL